MRHGLLGPFQGRRDDDGGRHRLDDGRDVVQVQRVRVPRHADRLEQPVGELVGGGARTRDRDFRRRRAMEVVLRGAGMDGESGERRSWLGF